MHPSRTVARTKAFCIGGMLVFTMSSMAEAGGLDDGGAMLRAAGHCETYAGTIDASHGPCNRSATHVRVGTRAASINAWSTDGTSNAGLRSDGSGMVPRAGDASHLRVRSGLESLSPFR